MIKNKKLKKYIIDKNSCIISKSISISFFKLDNIKSDQINFLRKISYINNINIIICKNKLLNIIFKNNNINIHNIKNNNLLLCHNNNPSISIDIFKKFLNYYNMDINEYLRFIYFNGKLYKNNEEIKYISSIKDFNTLINNFCLLLKKISIIRLYNILILFKNKMECKKC